MKKIVTSLFTVALLGTATLSATEFDYSSELSKMNELMTSMMKENFTHAKIANFGYPRVNVQDKNSSYVYEFDLAGVAKENIKLSINENNLLTIQGTKKSKIQSEKSGYTKQEIFYGSFQRVIQLAENADQEHLSTKYDNGILTLTIPKKELKKLKEKVIPIN